MFGTQWEVETIKAIRTKTYSRLVQLAATGGAEFDRLARRLNLLNERLIELGVIEGFGV